MSKTFFFSIMTLFLTSCTMPSLTPQNNSYPQNVTESHSRTTTIVPNQYLNRNNENIDYRLVDDSNPDFSRVVYLKIISANDPIIEKIQSLEKK